MNATPDVEPLAEPERSTLLQLARKAIAHRLHRGDSFRPEIQDLHPNLQRQQSSFVTLHLEARLRGCIGSLNAVRALAEDVAHNAQAAAFQDPRFQPLAEHELDPLEYHISVLGSPQPLVVQSREELLQTLRPGVDGVVLEERGRRATYLPSVWEQLGEPELFITQLRIKAGLDANGWSAETRVSVYQVQDFSDRDDPESTPRGTY